MYGVRNQQLVVVDFLSFCFFIVTLAGFANQRSLFLAHQQAHQVRRSTDQEGRKQDEAKRLQHGVEVM